MTSVIFLIVFILKANALPSIVKIGAIFREDQKNSTAEWTFKYAVNSINRDKSILPRTKLVYDIQYVKRDDSFHASKKVCSQIKMGVYAIFGPNDPLLVSHIHSICDALDIPHLEVRPYDDHVYFNNINKVKEPSSINLFPSLHLINTAFKDLILYLNWTKIGIIYENNNSNLMKLNNMLINEKRNDIEIIMRRTDSTHYLQILNEMKTNEIHNLIIDTNPIYMDEFLKGILKLQMNEYKYHYLFTSFDLETYDMEDFKYNFVNITGFRLINMADIGMRELIKDIKNYYYKENVQYFNEKFNIIETEVALIYDSLYVFAIGLQTLEQSHKLQWSNVTCDVEKPWDGGLSLINYINAVEWKGLTGPIEFKEGRRIQFKLDLIKLKQHAIVKVGEWTPQSHLNISDDTVFYDTGGAMNVTLVVITILEIPYVMMNYGKNFTGNARFYGFCVDILERIANEVGFDYILDIVPDRKYGAKDPITGEWNGMVAELMKHEQPYVMMRRPLGPGNYPYNMHSGNDSAAPQIPAKFKPYGRFLKKRKKVRNPNDPGYDEGDDDEDDGGDDKPVDYYFEGFCIDLLKLIADITGFEYKIELVPDGKYGVYDLTTGEWNGIVRQLLEKKADLAVGSMTINYARESVIDFTKPFMNLGISILFKVPTSQPTRLFSFMNPLAVDIWLYVFFAYALVSITMYVVARFSPYEWENPHPCEMENNIVENQFTIKNSFWFTIGTLMQQGSDLNPKATSTRIVGGIWWFFTLIIISSYTANLAAFLTVERMITPIENSDDLAGQTEISYGTLESGSTMTFFRDSMIETYKKMWRFMENKKPSVFTTTYEEGIRRVLEGNYAFLMESTMLDYIVQRDCNLTQIGGLLDTKGYGIATPIGSPWRDKISLAILELQEKGEIQMLYDKWWKNSDDTCLRQDKSKESKANALGVDNIGGVFVVLLCGLAFAVIIAIIEFCYNTKKLNLNDSNKFTMFNSKQSLCNEMTDELCFALRCHGSRQRPAMKRQCSKCVLTASTVSQSHITALPSHLFHQQSPPLHSHSSLHHIRPVLSDYNLDKLNQGTSLMDDDSRFIDLELKHRKSIDLPDINLVN